MYVMSLYTTAFHFHKTNWARTWLSNMLPLITFIPSFKRAQIFWRSFTKYPFWLLQPDAHTHTHTHARTHTHTHAHTHTRTHTHTQPALCHVQSPSGFLDLPAAQAVWLGCTYRGAENTEPKRLLGVCVCKNEWKRQRWRYFVFLRYTVCFQLRANAIMCVAFFCFCMLSTIKQVAPHRCATRPWSPPQRKQSYNSQVPSWLFSFMHCNGICLALSRPPSIYFIWTPPWLPLGSPGFVHILSPSHHGHLGGLFSFMHVQCSPWSSCVYSPSYHSIKLWPTGKGTSQKKNMPHGKLYLFPPNTHLKEMSQAYPENWERVAASIPTSGRIR